MLMEGSCHCGAVKFTCKSHTPQPYMRCYCSICRKTQGGGGFIINLAADNASLKVTGREHVKVYCAVTDGVKSDHERHFCGECGSHLWAWNANWPELLHPVASAIDTDLPKPGQFVDIMLDSAASWVELHPGAHIDRFDGYPTESIEGWHRARGLWEA